MLVSIAATHFLASSAECENKLWVTAGPFSPILKVSGRESVGDNGLEAAEEGKGFTGT
jgi:hypothetical protein